MIRKTLTSLSLIGLLFSVGLWGVSYWNMSSLHVRKSDEFRAELSQGCLFVRYDSYSFGGERERRAIWWVGGFRGFKTSLAIPYFARGGRGFQGYMVLYLPVNLLAILFGLTFLACRPLHHHRRRKRKKLGLCLKCGYDLRASKDRCPECGEEFEKQ